MKMYNNVDCYYSRAWFWPYCLLSGKSCCCCI